MLLVGGEDLLDGCVLATAFTSYGDSGGEPRQIESPAANARDIASAAAFLAARPEVVGETVGGMAICASAGYMAHAIADGADRRMGHLSGLDARPADRRGAA